MAARLAELRTRSSALMVEERAVLLVAPVLAVFLAWAAVEGGYSAEYWYPGALVVLALLVVSLVGRGGAASAPRAAVVGLACLAAFTAWSYASIAWAGAKGDAWDGANRTLLYLTVYALFLFLPWTLRGAHVVLGAYAAGVAAIAAWTLGRAATAAEPMSFFGSGTRLSAPTTYHNANCALFTFALVILVFLASRAGTPVLARAVAAAGSVVLTVVSLLAQSRGWLAALAVTVLLFLAIVPGRVRSAIALLTVGVAVAPLIQRALDVNEAAQLAAPGPALAAVGWATAVAAGAAAAAVALWALLERSFVPSARAARIADRALAAVLAAGLVLAAVLAVALGSPRERASKGWRDFAKVENPARSPTGPFLTRGVAGNRYDLWRVAVRAFRREPLTGIGADNFAADYFRERRALEEPRYPHSLELRALSQLGIVGAVLLAGFVGAAFAAALRRGRKAGAGLCATAVVGASYWLLHGSIDWFWEIPATTAPVFAALGISAALAGAAEPAEPGQPARRGRLETRVAVATAAGAVAAVAAASYVFPLVSALYVRDAAHSWRGDARAAFAALDRARRLNPLSDRPDLVKGAIASRLAEPEQMRRAFGAAVERNPDNWYGLLELGIAESLTGNRQQALAHLARAAELDPLETVIVRVERDVRAGKPVDPQEIDAIFLSRVAGSDAWGQWGRDPSVDGPRNWRALPRRRVLSADAPTGGRKMRRFVIGIAIPPARPAPAVAGATSRGTG